MQSRALSILSALIAAYMLYEAVTMPMVAAETPAILFLAFGIGAWVLWPRGTVAKAAPPVERVELVERRPNVVDKAAGLFLPGVKTPSDSATKREP